MASQDGSVHAPLLFAILVCGSNDGIARAFRIRSLGDRYKELKNPPAVTAADGKHINSLNFMRLHQVFRSRETNLVSGILS